MSAAPLARPASPSLAELIEDAAHWLPEQAPLDAFVHHNTLHALEDRPFEQAVVDGARVLGTQPFLSEADFAVHRRTGRIEERDVEAVLAARLAKPDAPVFAGGPTVQAFRALRLRHLFEIPGEATLRWLLEDGGAGERLHPDVPPRRRAAIAHAEGEKVLLRWLWARLESQAPHVEPPVVGARPRDRLRASLGVDTDAWVHPVLIRLAAAFLDQGIAYWSMPERELGFLRAVRRLYGRPLGPPFRWAPGLARTLAGQEREGWSAERTIEWSLAELGVAEADRGEVIRATLLSLRGWAGMMRHLELRPDRAPVAAPPARLADFLAVELLLDVFATRAAVREAGLGEEGPVALEGQPRRGPGCVERPRSVAGAAARVDRRLVYEAFVLAQLSDVPLSRFEEESVVRGWLEAVAAFDELERRCVLHLAYERRHRVQVLDGLDARSRLPQVPSQEVAFQAVFCIDDREESLRRHLEEVEPRVRTFGYAGFFGVAMEYRGLEDVRSRPLCPVVISPVHRIEETPTSGPGRSDYAFVRRRRGRASHAAAVGARTLVRGGLQSSVLGLLSTVPLVARALFPRIAQRVSHAVAEAGVERPETRLSIEAPSEGGDPSVPRTGYTVAEMTAIVEGALRTMGLDAGRATLVLIVGHGSSSLNNPHSAAYDCGATGGGRGGPNARAFAAMANHPGVREALRGRGITIPDATFFLGASHDTCDDSLVWYDEDLVPPGHREVVALARRALDRARARDAHERCRRFESAPLSIGPERALVEVEARSVDLGQPRPECGHATNAICLVGRRSRSRGLFLDRRAFLVSYDPERDPDGRWLAPLLLSVGPVGAGINLEYYFSYVDPALYGAGTKLPHNIVGLLGVMDGHASDLRTGLPWQMVEIHEPVRLLTVVDARREVLERILTEHEALQRLVGNGWIQLVCWEPEGDGLFVHEAGGFQAYHPESTELPVLASSLDYYRGRREHLAPALIGAPT